MMRSMTAYARVYKKQKEDFLEVTIRSLNSRYCEVLIHGIPQENVFIEDRVRKIIKDKIERGRIEVYILYKKYMQYTVEINEKLIGEYISALNRVSRKFHLSREWKGGDFITLPGVVSLKEDKQFSTNELLEVIKKAAAKLLEFKEKEGKTIAREIVKNFTKLEKNAEEISRLKPREVKEDNKDDIDEEVSLLMFYLKKMKGLIYKKSKKAKGKNIDFLSQEILRELNTASAKTRHSELSYLLVESKNCLEKIREQTQNIE